MADGYPGNGRNLLLGVDLGGAFPGLTRRLTSSRGFLAARGSRPFHQLSVVDMHRSFEDAPGQVLQARRAVGGAEFSSPGHLSPLRGESVQPVGHSVWSIESGIEDSAYAGNDQSKKARWAGLKRGKESQLSGLQTTFEILFHPRHEVHLRVEIAAKVRKEHSIAPSLYNRTGRVDQHRPTSKLPSMPERTASRSVSITNRSWRVDRGQLQESVPAGPARPSGFERPGSSAHLGLVGVVFRIRNAVIHGLSGLPGTPT